MAASPSEVAVIDLPPLLAEICELIGLPGTLALVKHYGGRHVDTPRHYIDDHPLTRAIGREAAVKFIERYKGDRVYIARMAYALRVIRDCEIARKFEGGSRAWQLASEYGLTERAIWNILKRPHILRSAPQQGDLFGGQT